MSSVLVAIFDSKAQAEAAKARLIAAGIPRSASEMTSPEESSSMPAKEGAGEPARHHEGAIARFFDHLFGDWEDGDRERAGYMDRYSEAFRRGAYALTVTVADDAEMERAEKILTEAGAVDIDERAEQWRASGWADSAPQGDKAHALEAGGTQKLQEVEEKLEVGKRAVARGGVRIFTRMTEVPVEETVRLREEHATVQRRAVDRPATEADLAGFKEGSFEVREMSEEVVVSKTARVVAEVEVGKTANEREETVRDTVRKTKVDVENIEGEAGRDDFGKEAVLSEGPDEAEATGTRTRTAKGQILGSHPVGTGVGAAGGAAAGAAAGSVAGPAGTVIGAAAGTVAGGLAGKGVAESVEPTADPKGTRKP